MSPHNEIPKVALGPTKRTEGFCGSYAGCFAKPQEESVAGCHCRSPHPDNTPERAAAMQRTTQHLSGASKLDNPKMLGKGRVAFEMLHLILGQRPRPSELNSDFCMQPDPVLGVGWVQTPEPRIQGLSCADGCCC